MSEANDRDDLLIQLSNYLREPVETRAQLRGTLVQLAQEKRIIDDVNGVLDKANAPQMHPVNRVQWAIDQWKKEIQKS